MKKRQWFVTTILALFLVCTFHNALAGDCREILASTSPLSLTTNWQDVGSSVNIGNVDGLDLYLAYDKNDGNGVQLQVLKRESPDYAWGYLQGYGNEVAPTPVSYGDIVFYPKVDADGVVWLPVNFRNASGLKTEVKLQAKIATPGATPAQVDYSRVCFSE